MCVLQVTELRCSRASVFVESTTFGIDYVHRAVLLNPGVYLGIPSTFGFVSLLCGFVFLWRVLHVVLMLCIGPCF